MASQNEIIDIVRGFLLNSPPGEFDEVITDVRGLLKDDSILDKFATKTFQQWNVDQMLQCQSPAGEHQVLITKFGEISDNEYIDPRGNCVVKFDHVKQHIVSHRPIKGELFTEVEAHRSALDIVIQAYTENYYLFGGSTVYGAKDASEYILTACISAARYRPTNYWNGRWRSSWICTFKPTGSEVRIEGTIKLNVHYYEDGNVMLLSNTKLKTTCSNGDPETLAQNIIAAIQSVETKFHHELEESYQSMGETTFKALRRVLPVTRSKIDWTKIHQMRIGREAVDGE